MNSVQRLEEWITHQENLINSCEDDQEKFNMECKLRTINANKPYSIRSKLEKGAYHYFCVECGVIEFSTYFNNETMIENQLCFSCNHWKEKSDNYLNNPGNTLIIKGALYSDGGNKKNPSNTSFLGHAGREFTIQRKDGELWKTNNLWCGGDIPLKYRSTTMQDNAVML